MTLKFPYQKYPDPDSKGGFFYSAVLPVSVALPALHSPRSKRFEAYIDSGATYCQFQSAMGRALGFDIEKGELVKTMGISGPTEVYLHEISLYLPGGIVSTIATFSESLPVLGLLGMKGFFEHFTVTFNPFALRVELERIYSA